ncbi:hypothetical protein AB7645_42140 [Bradyrhizobium sp. 956_D2_N1_5]|jgi:hypothetical protein|uniref:hypothetical protein n=1 Tax=unclassified Bradyrhizobium TaxID=2631580 RepID=UPI003F2497B4
MRTILIILGAWLLINVLAVVVLIAPRKRRAPNSRLPVRADAPPADDPPLSLRHVIIAVALGAFFSLTLPLLEAYDALRRGFLRFRGRTVGENGKVPREETLVSKLTKLRTKHDGRLGEKQSDEDNKG